MSSKSASFLASGFVPSARHWQSGDLRFLPGGLRHQGESSRRPGGVCRSQRAKINARLRGSASAITLVTKAPNPNAAKVFINWFLSRRGQKIYQESHGDRDSMRVDIPKDEVPVSQRRVSGKKYFSVEGPQYMDVKPALKIVDDG
jgi:hypothetical protein